MAPSTRSSGGTGWIVAMAEDGSNIQIEYVVPKKLSRNVVPDRISVSNIDNTSRSQDENTVLLSLLSSNYGVVRDFRKALASAEDNNAVSQPKKPSRNRRLSTDDLLRMPIVDAYGYLEKRQHEFGWLRVVEGYTESTRRKQLSLEEKHKIMFLHHYLAGLDSLQPRTHVLAKYGKRSIHPERNLNYATFISYIFYEDLLIS